MMSKYRLTHLFINFLTEPEHRRKFQRVLMNLGFVRFDTHTYFRPTAPGKVDEIMTAIREATPYASTIRVMRITDKQWTDTNIIIGK